MATSTRTPLSGAALLALVAACSGGSNGSASSDAGRHDASFVEASSGDRASPPAMEAALPPLESSPPATIAPAARKDAASTPVVFDALRGTVWAANGDVGSISYVGVNHDDQKVLAEIPVGQDIRSVALSSDEKWVAAVDREGGTVSLVDAASRTLARTIPVGTHPRGAVWDAADPRWLYVALEDAGAVAVVDRTLGVLSKTVPVGRIPGGVAVSRLHPYLYVTHRIDPTITLLSLPDLTLVNDVVLADDPVGPPLTNPQGKPFAFESVAFTPDGNTLWVPHELLAPTHPIVFNETLFPAVSVVDISGRGEEVQTDPNDPFGVVAGRKLLFGAIDLLDSSGNVVIVSQPCAAAIHPTALTGYVLACGSQDLLTFDMTQGIAVDILRNLPGSHPIGMTFDAPPAEPSDASDASEYPLSAARAFVLFDQSHTLLTLDLAGGSVLGHVSILDGPLSLIAKDTVDPELRAGEELFFDADSSTGSLATTGNDWMSCGGCHLDGFGSPTLRLFESSLVVDETKNAQIGHSGLVDLFSTAPTPASSTFDPHDVLSALEEQGGLAPDRTGADRTGQIDPSAPTAAAKTMAQQIARVIARDLPFGPTWVLPKNGPPTASYDTTWCGKCHEKELAAWQTSLHAHSGADPMVRFCVKTEQAINGTQYSRLCAGCHDPVSLRLGDSSFTSGRGVTCLGCHEVSRPIHAGGNGDLEVTSVDWTKSHAEAARAALVTIRQPELCAGCHEQFVPGDGLSAITTYDEWAAGPSANDVPELTCVGCHMPVVDGAADHTAVGGNVYFSTELGEPQLAAAQTAKLHLVMGLTATRANDGTVTVTLDNHGSGHTFPTGVTDIREPWVELQAVDGSGNVLAHYGGPDANGLLPPTSARLGIDIADADGGLLYDHQLSRALTIPFDRRVPPGGEIDVTLTAPAMLPSGATELDAVLLYHNVRTSYYQDALGTKTGSAPAVEMARVMVPPAP